MKKIKNTKKALLMSALSLLLCVSMMIGTTFAWFNDSVTSEGNVIKAGKLDVSLYKLTGAEEGDRVNITDESDPIMSGTSTLWEPGKTEVIYFSIKNDGSLPLKCTVNIAAANPEAPVEGKNLYQVMQYAITAAGENQKYGYVNAWVDPADDETTFTFDVAELEAGEEYFFALSVHMAETANNDYMEGQVNFDIEVIANQVEYVAENNE